MSRKASAMPAFYHSRTALAALACPAVLPPCHQRKANDRDCYRDHGEKEQPKGLQCGLRLHAPHQVGERDKAEKYGKAHNEPSLRLARSFHIAVHGPHHTTGATNRPTKPCSNAG